MWQAAGVTPPSTDDSLEGLTRLINEPSATLLVAVVKEQLVGSVIAGWDGWRGNIYRLAVAPDYRRRGIARDLVRQITNALFVKGANRISALVEHEHEWAIRFWNSMNKPRYQRDTRFVRYLLDRPQRKRDKSCRSTS